MTDTDLAQRVRVLEHKIAKLEDLLESSLVERDLPEAGDALEYRAHDAEKRLRKPMPWLRGRLGTKIGTWRCGQAAAFLRLAAAVDARCQRDATSWSPHHGLSRLGSDCGRR